MFYEFAQNNSGGYFIENDDVAAFLIIEANNVSDAVAKLNDVTEDYSEYCGCCGQRWDTWIDEDEGTETPTIYDIPVQQYLNEDGYYSRHKAIIYYLDGTKETVSKA